jgi:type IV secretion system protein VirB5
VSTTGKTVLMTVLALGAGIPAARAQFAVIDVAAVAQLVSQLQTLEQQLATAKADLTQAQSAYQSTVGGRGMEQLLSGTNRNYLPPTWSTLQGSFQSSGGAYSGLSSDLTVAVNTNAILSPQRLAGSSPAAQRQVQSDRQTVALLQAISHEALATASNRFASLQQLINAIGSASDQKSVLDLQARIAAESAMLQNEQAKLQVLYQSVLAQEWANEQQGREQAVASYGQFSSRFRPTP